MMNSFIDALPIVLLIVFVLKAYPAKPITDINKDYLSVYTTKCYRGLFALIIVFHHLALRTDSGFVFPFFVRVGYLPVAFFFFLSGYGLQKSYITKQEKYKKNFLKRRMSAVLIPYIFMFVIYWFMYYLSVKILSLSDIFNSFIKGDPIVSNSWYIVNILVFYIVFWLLMSVCKKRYLLMILLGCMWYVLHALMCMIIGYESWWYNTTHLLILGMIWATYEDEIIKIIKRVYFIAAPVVWLSFIISFGFYIKISNALFSHQYMAWLIISSLSAILFVISVILFSMKIHIGNTLLSFLGSISLEIYLSHGLFINGINRFISIENEFIWCIMVISFTIGFAFLFHLLISLISKRLILSE